MKLSKIGSLLVGKQKYFVDNVETKFNIDMMDFRVIAINGHEVYLTSKNYQQARYDYLKSKGLCCACGEENDTEGTYCTQCVKFRKVSKKRTREFYEEMGRCTNCGSEKTEQDVKPSGEHYKTCKKCRDYFYKKNLEMRTKKNV